MKKSILVFISLVIVFSMTGCGLYTTVDIDISCKNGKVFTKWYYNDFSANNENIKIPKYLVEQHYYLEYGKPVDCDKLKIEQ